MSQAPAAPADATRSTRVSILVVDDNDDHRLLIVRRLRDAGHTVTMASSGAEALAALEDVDLVLLDYRLPGLSGLDTLRAIRELDGPSVVMVTGMGSESIAVEAMRAGAIDYVVKDAGYLGQLPQLVARAWRTHDLARRARELQRLALLVTSATKREAVFAEIVAGSRRLLRADACALYLTTPSGLALEAVDGGSLADPAGLQSAAASVLAAEPRPGPAGPTQSGDRLLVPLPSSEGGSLGVLAIVTDGPREYLAEEVSLARTFASFCGMALAHLHQLELERSLVAELQEMLELRRELVASVSHELRTPLTCILGFASTLLHHWEALDEPAKLDFVHKIRRHGTELGDLVEGLLDFASTEAGRLVAEVHPVDLGAQIDQALQGLAPLLEGREVSITGTAHTVQADPALLRRTISNLVSNAVKYSDAPLGIEIAAHLDGDMVRVEVVDHGVGLSSDEAGRVFEPFWRAERGVNRKRGTGIGLALVRDYVRLMGGTVGVESEAKAGSTFWFTLPQA